ncbi:hypothetical protein PUN28_006837 [Cardiocondyla obscurior]|uniref:Uncharacterized protein n=1 Tax=Cardiocondyla obscurior TaxID=286306 RepID=A0AAW2G069_9HYME
MTFDFSHFDWRRICASFGFLCDAGDNVINRFFREFLSTGTDLSQLSSSCVISLPLFECKKRWPRMDSKAILVFSGRSNSSIAFIEGFPANVRQKAYVSISPW